MSVNITVNVPVGETKHARLTGTPQQTIKIFTPADNTQEAAGANVQVAGFLQMSGTVTVQLLSAQDGSVQYTAAPINVGNNKTWNTQVTMPNNANGAYVILASASDTVSDEVWVHT
jgi:hypothetical protein